MANDLPGWRGKPGTWLPGLYFLGEGVMSNRETYRQKALHCLRAADRMRDSGERVALLSLASNYMTLANYVGGYEDRAARRADSSRSIQDDC